MANKWIPLDGKKEPPANKPILIAFKDNGWIDAKLRRIEFSEGKKDYIFGSGETEWDNATHFMEIEPPKNNQ